MDPIWNIDPILLNQTLVMDHHGTWSMLEPHPTHVISREDPHIGMTYLSIVPLDILGFPTHENLSRSEIHQDENHRSMGWQPNIHCPILEATITQWSLNEP
jgi:hypothetical protein